MDKIRILANERQFEENIRGFAKEAGVPVSEYKNSHNGKKTSKRWFSEIDLDIDGTHITSPAASVYTRS